MFYLLALLGFAFVIIIHELGHFVFAKLAGVRVDRFSVGMGPIIWSKTIGETEYAVSLLPIGGYVKMLGQEDVPGRNPDDLSERSYLAKSRPWKAAILFGGVLFNLVSSWIILVILAWWGAPIIEPVVGGISREEMGPDQILRETPAWILGLRPGDRILEVNGSRVRDFTDIMLTSMSDGNRPVTMRIERGGERFDLPPAGVEPVPPVPSHRLGRPVLGIDHPEGNRIVQVGRLIGSERQPDDPRPHERLLGSEDTGQDFAGWTGQMISDHLLPFVGTEVALRLGSADGERVARFRYAGDGDSDLLAAGLGLPVLLRTVQPDRPAAEAGLRAGDVVARVDGTAVAGNRHFQSLVRRAVAAERPLRIEALRPTSDGWQALEVSVEARLDERLGRVLIGVGLDVVDAGVLPHVSPALGSEERPLLGAGLQPGDAVVRWRSAGAVWYALAVPEAEQRSIPMAEEVWHQLTWIPAQGLLGRLGTGLFGLQPPRSLYQQIVGCRVERVDAELGELLVHRPDAEDAARRTPRVVSVRRRPEALRQALLELAPGDWVCDTLGVGPDGEPAMVVVQSTAEESEEDTAVWTAVRPADPGVSLRMMVEQTPLVLDHWSEAFAYANHQAVAMVVVTLRLIPRFFTSQAQGGIDAGKSLQGPIGIFNELSARLELMGMASFLHLLALIGLNLFLINLLPIPIVDGGQLLFLGVEAIIRRPVPMRIQEAANWLGLALIVFLMLFVIGNDIARLLTG